jgi:hypothetical protein
LTEKTQCLGVAQRLQQRLDSNLSQFHIRILEAYRSCHLQNLPPNQIHRVDRPHSDVTAVAQLLRLLH